MRGCLSWIGGKDLRQTSGEAHLTINKNRLTNISGNQDLHILQNHHLHINQKWLSKIDQKLHIKTGQTIVLEAATAMSFDAGGSTLLLDNSGIKLQGSTIRINSGGVASDIKNAALTKIELPITLSSVLSSTTKRKLILNQTKNIEFYDEQIQLIDRKTSQPLVKVPYVIRKKSNQETLAVGDTDHNGLTIRVSSYTSDEIEIIIGKI